jgi:hypothetical protein
LERRFLFVVYPSLVDLNIPLLTLFQLLLVVRPHIPCTHHGIVK